MKKITFYLSLVMVAMVINLEAQVTYIDENFEATDISGGSVPLASGFPQFNYTADIAGGNENYTDATVTEKTNAVAIHNRSASANFVAAYVSGKQVLRVSGGANYLTDDAGVYFTGLDLTGQTVLYFSFQVLGGDKADGAGIETTLQSWSINLNHGNSSTGFVLSDSFFGVGTNVTTSIPFNINNDGTITTNQTSFDIIPGQWITIYGSVDLTDKTLGSFGAFQIQTDTGGFVSGGKVIYALDNVYVATTPTLSNSSFELNNSVKVYPNPVNNILKIDNSLNVDIKQMSLVNVLGKTVYSSEYKQSIDVTLFSKGIYFLRLTSDKNGEITKKIVID
ncbi:T9SS type A sorting domain-containing protein [Mariniflexile ostreae]|uniref:T9SS type A sorting domain-containing protein n=1 Tax=Mariniflexile ostreae TaxID=1520892 RepID=A0ABV5FC67_9FLAO